MIFTFSGKSKLLYVLMETFGGNGKYYYRSNCKSLMTNETEGVERLLLTCYGQRAQMEGEEEDEKKRYWKNKIKR